MISGMENDFVADTHIWISFFYRNRMEEILQKCISKNINFRSCAEQLKEFSSVYRYPLVKKKKLLPLTLKVYQDLITNATDFFEPQKRFSLLTDYKDNYLIDLAHQTGSILISDDKGFLPMKKLAHPKVEIISLKKFYSLLEE